MSLSEYIERHGDGVCAALFKVKERTVASWRRRENFPRAKKAREIVDVTNGDVTMEGIYAPAPSPAPGTEPQLALDIK